ncbi:conserved hypothetical protein [Candidatus Sulfopaludibacter sp. SbA4]|nr:conserved hypothetical protein [Candidatus Sulfopaludibacter sp. SbA4]
MKHLVDRFREGRISVADFDALRDWLASNPEVPDGQWFIGSNGFRNSLWQGEGETPKTFLTPGMVPYGQEVN